MNPELISLPVPSECTCICRRPLRHHPRTEHRCPHCSAGHCLGIVFDKFCVDATTKPSLPKEYVAVTLFGAYNKQIIKPSTYVATLHCKVDLLHVHTVHNTTTNVRMLSTHESLRELPNLSAARQLQNQAHSVEEESIKRYIDDRLFI